MKKNHVLNNSQLLNITQRQQVKLSDVILLQGDINYTILNLTCGKKIIASSTLKSFEQTFPQSQFIRISKSIMLNKAFVKNISHNQITLKNEQVMTVSRRRVQYVRDNIK